MKIKTSELTGAALDWAVAICEGHTPYLHLPVVSQEVDEVIKKLPEADAARARRIFTRPVVYLNANRLTVVPKYSTDWAQGGPIVAREMRENALDLWRPYNSSDIHATYERGLPDSYATGPTPLIAAMRCRVEFKLGDEVDVPDELVGGTV